MDSANPSELVDRSMPFHPSAPGSIGIELELPILDRDTGALVPGAKRLLQACEDEKLEGVGAELMQSMIELRTPPCSSIHELDHHMRTRLRALRILATSLGYDFALVGIHPFQRLTDHAVFPDQRFQDASLRMAWLTYYRVAFGLHIHIGMSSGDQAVTVMNHILPYLAHLVALSGNSPFWQGVDTGFASCRCAMTGLVPHSCTPPPLSRWKDFREYYKLMRDCRVMASYKDIKWDVRPRPDLGTLEIRICDMPHSLVRITSMAALLRALVLGAKQLLEEKPQARRSDPRWQWIATENRSVAARYGLDAVYIRAPTGKRKPLLDDLSDLVSKVMPHAAQRGDERFLAPLTHVKSLESGADRQRQAYRETGDWVQVMHALMQELAAELKPAKQAAGRSEPRASARADPRRQ